jgi:AbrB family looped-hinge helix DNA binding protein
MHNKKLFGTATVGTKGQVVIPAAARDKLGIAEGDRMYVIGSESGEWVGFIKEDKLAEIVSSLVDNVEVFQNILKERSVNEPLSTSEK